MVCSRRSRFRTECSKKSRHGARCWMSESASLRANTNRKPSCSSARPRRTAANLKGSRKRLKMTRIRARIARQRYLDGLRLADSGAWRRPRRFASKMKCTRGSWCFPSVAARRTGCAHPSPPMPPASPKSRSTETSHGGHTRTGSCFGNGRVAHPRRRCPARAGAQGRHGRFGTGSAGDGVQPGQALLDIVPRVASCRDGCSYRRSRWASSNPARKCACIWTPFRTNATVPSRGV